MATSVPNTSLAAPCSARVKPSSPYDGTDPVLAALTAAMTASQAGVTLSLLKFLLTNSPCCRSRPGRAQGLYAIHLRCMAACLTGSQSSLPCARVELEYLPLPLPSHSLAPHR